MQLDSNGKIKSNYTLILGSGSPRRQELLKGLGFDFQLSPINANEDFPDGLSGREITLYLSEKKSNCYAKPLEHDELLITADTIVWVENEVLNKPQDRNEAKSMLLKLSGKKHEVYTGICLRSLSKTTSFFEKSDVYFKKLSEAEIEFYIDNFPVYDKAGSYGVQDWIGYIGIERIDGSFYNVMGLPVKRLYEELSIF